VKTTEAPPTLTHPSLRFEHGQITPPLESSETLDPRGPSFFSHSFLDTISAEARNGSSHDAFMRQWLDDIPSAAQRMMAAGLNVNKRRGKDRKNGQSKVKKGARSGMQDRRPSTDASVMSHVAQTQVNCEMADLLYDLHL
jgi:hypothetical protein